MKTLSADELYKCCDEEVFDFETTGDLPALEGTIGQTRALAAIDFGLTLESSGFNIFLLGENGTGKMSTIRSVIEKKALSKPVPADWCYVYNFKNPDEPLAISLSPGSAVAFQKDMEELVKTLRIDIPKVFESKEYEKQKSKLVKEFQKKQRDLFSSLDEEAQSKAFSILKTVSGLVIVPVKKSGEPLTEEDFADIESETGTIDPESLKKHITPKTKAIIAVSWGGTPCRLTELERLCNMYGLVLIQDNAQALGATYKGYPLSEYGDISCYSFQATKHLTTGDGGMVSVEARTCMTLQEN